MVKNQDVVELDLMELLQAIWHRLWAVILAALILGGAAFGFTYCFITPKYQAKTLMYVNNSSFSLGSSSFSISSSELTAAQKLVETYIVILGTRTTLNEVIDYAELSYSYEQLSDMISASAKSNTEIFEVTVTSTDPLEAEHIANAIAKVLPDKIANVVDGSSVRIVDYAVVPSSRFSPSYTKNTMIGIVAGTVIAAVIIAIRTMLDVYIRSEQYLTQTYNIPVLSAIPDMRVPSGKAYYSSPGKGSAASKEKKEAKTNAG